MTAPGTQHTYRTWIRRLVAAYGDRTPESVTAGDLTDLIAEHVLAGRTHDERRRSGKGAEENAVAAYRRLGTYLVEKGYATANVANRLRKPTRAEPRRRGFTVEEAALLRQLARAGRDPLLDELTLVLPERLGLRRIELCRLRVSDIDLDQASVEVWGKGDKDRITVLTVRSPWGRHAVGRGSAGGRRRLAGPAPVALDGVHRLVRPAQHGGEVLAGPGPGGADAGRRRP
jgi:site-specific recombinase XerD